MQEIAIPQKFLDKINESSLHQKVVSESIHNFQELLNASKLEFFPEYNNHGILHLNNIFKIQEELITDASYKILTSEDLTVLVVATLTHDIAMHLELDGFFTLKSEELEFTLDWKKKWFEFFQNAKKYNEKKLFSLFGENEPINELPNSKVKFTKKDNLLIGEFLRINHPDLAQEIITNGFPIKDNQVMNLSEALQKEDKLLNFTALLAKSHGKNIRDTFSEIEQYGREGDLLNPYNIHIIYLMVVLRLSDYLDIDKNRNNKIILGLKNFISDQSYLEWDKNTSINEIKKHWKDKEAIFFGVSPNNSISFLNLKSLFQDIQREFDTSWAVLGEVYSKDDELKNLGICYRRVYSDLDNEKEFEKKANFVAKKVTFKSDTELLKLLIAPLYGDSPSYGVRELLQNAVDACKELKKIYGEDSDYNPEIYVDVYDEDGEYFFEIVDNGIGMTEDTIINYLLNAGASFRNSETWRENFEDEDDNATVERTGRFGVGLLAAFLIGFSIEVKSRYFDENKGCFFETQLKDSQINITFNSSLLIGTSIKIKLSDSNFQYFSNKSDWKEWYLLDDIDIYYNQTLNNKYLSKNSLIEIEQDEFTKVCWLRIKGDELKELYGNFSTYRSFLICNGFRIPDENIEIDYINDFISHKITNQYFHRFKLEQPILIEDRNSKFPLSLDRKTLMNKKFSFAQSFGEKISEHAFDYLIKTFKKNKKNLVHNLFFHFPYLEVHKFSKKLILSQNGFSLYHPYFFNKNKVQKFIYIELYEKTNINNDFILSILAKGHLVVLNYNNLSNSSGYSDLFFELDKGYLTIEDKIFLINMASLIIPKSNYNKLFTYKNNYIKSGVKDKLLTSNLINKKNKTIIEEVLSSERYLMNFYKSKFELAVNIEEIEKYEEIALISEIYINDNVSSTATNNFFYKKFEEYFTNSAYSWLPYSDESK